jgi:hypothetical protein
VKKAEGWALDTGQVGYEIGKNVSPTRTVINSTCRKYPIEVK